jgi:hypothetical protein
MKLSKLLTLTLFTLPTLPGLANAGTLTDKAYQVAAQLGTREPSLSPTQQTQVNHELDNLLALLNGQTPPSHPYLCVSRDNDNTRPFVIAYKDFANTIRISGVVFNSKEECEESLGAGQAVQARFFLCATRDNDGSRPFKIVGLNGSNSATMLQRSVLSTMEDCIGAVRAMQARPEGLLYCGSRDNDGSAPFAQTGLRNDGTYVQSREEYRSLGDCNSNL